MYHKKVTSVIEAVELHRELWTWLSENPGKRKANWPRFREFTNVMAYCFACEINNYAGNGTCRTCAHCLFDWGNNEVKDFPCFYTDSGEKDGLYYLWYCVIDFLMRNTGTIVNHHGENELKKIASYLAKEIAELPLSQWAKEQVGIERKETIKDCIKNTCIELHRELWDWLILNPFATKSEWPHWEREDVVAIIYGRDFDDELEVSNKCFCCEYTLHENDGNFGCRSCPLDWGAELEITDDIGCQCEVDEHGNEGLFKLWNHSLDAEYRVELAKEIRDLPVRDGV